MSRHLENLANQPLQIGARVRIKDDGMGGEIHRVMGATYEHRMVPCAGWTFWLVEETEIDEGAGGYDGFSADDLQLVF